jgi:D-alanyl-lipoteichoic acid acyltransferase DltB (MBOAT superfamily)
VLFSEPIFILLFLPIVWAGFVLMVGRGHHRAIVGWLVATSLVFYGWWKPAYLPLIIVSMVFNYAVGIRLQRTSARRRRAWLALGVAANLLLLGYFKYVYFFGTIVNAMSGMEWSFPRLLLPLGISFFTFQQIGFLVDSYREETRRYSFLDYCGFVLFFPQLIAGPIVLHSELVPQLEGLRRRPDGSALAVGVSIFLIGLAKKVLVADTVAGYATPVFDASAAGATLTFADAWSGALAYTVQLYFDFSGYSDMAIGLGLMFGIRLPLNFDSPYRAHSIIDFWRRWHITLGRWLRDYLYVPLGGNRRGAIRRYGNLMVTMLLGGLWHGAGWTFVIWGGLHGFYLLVNHAWRQAVGGRAWRKAIAGGRLGRMCAGGLTFLCVVVGWVFFRSESIAAALRVLRAMSGQDGISLPVWAAGFIPSWSGLTFGGLGRMVAPGAVLMVGAALCVAWVAPNVGQLFAAWSPTVNPVIRPSKLKWSPLAPVGFCLGVGFFLVVKTYFSSRPSEFLYFNF